ncbi:MAG: DUF5810 domain-containing protein [Halococcoides sp.]
MYECPVCGDRQADLDHLADHVAITASMGGGEHERWLDAHASDWPALTAEELADRIAASVQPIEPGPDTPSVDENADRARDAFQAGLDATDPDADADEQ